MCSQDSTGGAGLASVSGSPCVGPGAPVCSGSHCQGRSAKGQRAPQERPRRGLPRRPHLPAQCLCPRCHRSDCSLCLDALSRSLHGSLLSFGAYYRYHLLREALLDILPQSALLSHLISFLPCLYHHLNYSSLFLPSPLLSRTWAL